MRQRSFFYDFDNEFNNLNGDLVGIILKKCSFSNQCDSFFYLKLIIYIKLNECQSQNDRRNCDVSDCGTMFGTHSETNLREFKFNVLDKIGFINLFFCYRTGEN